MINKRHFNDVAKKFHTLKVNKGESWLIIFDNGFKLLIDFGKGNYTFAFDFFESSSSINPSYISDLPIQFLESFIVLADNYVKELFPNPDQKYGFNMKPIKNISFRKYITNKTGLKFTIDGLIAEV